MSVSFVNFDIPTPVWLSLYQLWSVKLVGQLVISDTYLLGRLNNILRLYIFYKEREKHGKIRYRVLNYELHLIQTETMAFLEVMLLA